MKITVLSGSPKGEDSVTYQYVRYVRKHFPAVDFSLRHIGRDIKKIEADPGAFAEVVSDVRGADGVIWAFPVYHLSVPSRLKRFIELAFERSPDAFRGKYATALTTSVHFYDHTAHNYVNGVSCDLVYRMSGVFGADYRFYKMYRLFNYPQKHLKNRLVNFGMRQLMKVPQVRKEFYSRIRSDMAGSYRKIVGE